jgi:hypothetical protein
MKTVTHLLQGSLIAAAVLASAGAAVAQEASPLPASEEEVLSAEDLGELSGGTGVTVAVLTEQTLGAVNAGNTVTGQTVGSGDVNISSGAFSGFDGVGNFVINTGHNNNLQSSMNVSVVLTPPSTP